jgi:hypothetical protein
MKVSITLAVVVLLATFCVAQTPTLPAPAVNRVDVFAGYSYLDQNAHINFSDGAGNFFHSFTGGLNGGNLGATLNLNKTFGLKADFSAWTGGGNFTTSSKQYELAFGPVIGWRKGNWHPAVELLAGVGHRNASGFGFKGGQNTFAGIAGVIVDYRVRPHFTLRPIEARYMWNNWQNVTIPKLFSSWNSGSGQSNFSVNTGVVVTF